MYITSPLAPRWAVRFWWCWPLPHWQYIQSVPSPHASCGGQSLHYAAGSSTCSDPAMTRGENWVINEEILWCVNDHKKGQKSLLQGQSKTKHYCFYLAHWGPPTFYGVTHRKCCQNRMSLRMTFPSVTNLGSKNSQSKNLVHSLPPFFIYNLYKLIL